MVLMGVEIPLPAVRRQIASGIDLIVHLGRVRDGTRKGLQIMELLGYKSMQDEINTQVLYEFEEEGDGSCGEVRGTLLKRNDLSRTQKLQNAGILI